MKLAKAACPDNVYEQGAYISGFLQAVDMVYEWDFEAVDSLAQWETVAPFNFSNFVEECDDSCPICGIAEHAKTQAC